MKYMPERYNPHLTYDMFITIIQKPNFTVFTALFWIYLNQDKLGAKNRKIVNQTLFISCN